MFPLNMVIPAAEIKNKLVCGVYMAYIIIMSFTLACVWEAMFRHQLVIVLTKNITSNINAHPKASHFSRKHWNVLKGEWCCTRFGCDGVNFLHGSPYGAMFYICYQNRVDSTGMF